jgi:hypothetical protein
MAETNGDSGHDDPILNSLPGRIPLGAVLPSIGIMPTTRRATPAWVLWQRNYAASPAGEDD